jgi:proline racemase
VARVTFRNVPAYVIARGVACPRAVVDVAYGGAIYAFVPAADLGVPIVPEALPELIRAGREIKSALDGTDVAVHAGDPRLSGIYGTVIHEQVGSRHHRNVVIFADGEVDRSPTGSATSARTALLDDDGAIADGASWRNDSIIGTSFHARVVGRVPSGVITEVEGAAFRTGEHRFFLDPRDDLGTGFVLR